MGEESGLGESRTKCAMEDCRERQSPHFDGELCHKHSMEKWICGGFDPRYEQMIERMRVMGRRAAEARIDSLHRAMREHA